MDNVWNTNKTNGKSLFLYEAIFVLVPPSLTAAKIIFSMILGRTDLWISLSRAKFDEEADFEVRLAVDPQKSYILGEKQIF